jgi:hypothetical protein
MGESEPFSYDRTVVLIVTVKYSLVRYLESVRSNPFIYFNLEPKKTKNTTKEGERKTY